MRQLDAFEGAGQGPSSSSRFGGPTNWLLRSSDPSFFLFVSGQREKLFSYILCYFFVFLLCCSGLVSRCWLGLCFRVERLL